MTAREDLNAAIDRAAREWLRIPCAGHPDRWTSDDLAELEQAAADCDGCPVIRECAAVGRLEKWGVWGGRVVWPRHVKRPQSSRRGRPSTNEGESA